MHIYRFVLFALLAASLPAASPAHQPPGTIIVDSSEFFDQMPPGDTMDADRSMSGVWLFNNTCINLISKEDAVAKITVPEAGAYHLFVRSQGAPNSSFRVVIDGKPATEAFGNGPLSFRGGGAFDLKKGTVEVRLADIRPRAMLNVIVLAKNAGFQEKELQGLELPEEVVLLKEYPIPGASAVKFGDVEGDGKMDFLVLTGTYSARMYNHDGKLLWQWDAPPENARLRGEFEAPGSIWDFDQDGFAEVVHWRIIDGVERLVMADGRTGAIKHSVLWPTPPLPHVYNNFRTAIARFHPGYPDNLVVFTDSGGTISLTAYDKELNQIWQHSEQRKKDYFGHYPYPIDLNGDGIDEVLISHLCLDAKGKTIWQNDYLFDDNHDHMDSMVFLDLNGDGKLELITGQSDIGIEAYNALTGELLWQNLADHTQQVQAGYILKGMKTPQVLANGRIYGSGGGGGLAAWLYYFDNKGNLLMRWPRTWLGGNPDFVKGDWYGNGQRVFFWHKFKLNGDGKGTLFFKATVYHMFDFMGSGADQVITREGEVLRVYGNRDVKPKVVKRDPDYKRYSIANHTHY